MPVLTFSKLQLSKFESNEKIRGKHFFTLSNHILYLPPHLARPSSPAQAAALQSLNFFKDRSSFLYRRRPHPRIIKTELKKVHTNISFSYSPILNHFCIPPSISLGTPVLTMLKPQAGLIFFDIGSLSLFTGILI